MKQEKIKTEVMFKCDNCLKETKFLKHEIGKNPFPYNKGWVFVYNFSIKVFGQRLNIKDKHFCCLDCLNGFIGNEIKKIKERQKKKK